MRCNASASMRSWAFVVALCAIAGCGGSSAGQVALPKVAPARTYSLAGFTPSGPVSAGRPTTISFTIRQPSGRPLTAYRTCCDPHKGIDLIIVRSDDSNVQYDDSDIAASGRVTQPVTFTSPGRYRVIVDAYPARTSAGSLTNFQLTAWVTVRGTYHPQPLPAFHTSTTVDGYRFEIHGHPRIQAIEADFLDISVFDRHGHRASFGSWRGALAHSIFIRAGTLDYFHTHVCSPGSIYCTSALGSTRVTGSSSTPGELRVGVLLPAPGRWRMFLLTYIGGRHLIATFTLDARS